MPLSLQKNGEDFQWPEEPVRLLSGGNPHQARWSISAKPHAWWWWEDGVAFRVDQNGQCSCQPTNAPLQDFAEFRADFPGTFTPSPGGAPFAGGWIGFLGYELGATLDPAFAQFAPPPGLQAAFAWCPELEIEDRLKNPSDFDTHPKHGDIWGDVDPQAKDRGSDLCASEWRERVGAVLHAIGQGDCYQVNLTRREYRSITGPLGPVVHALLETGQPRHGADLPLPGGRRIVSVSPESFLVRRGDQLLTRPIKGTRPSDGDPDELLNSAKDAAELHMIVDLLRNDLGRVAVPGEVRVREPRAIERHATVLQTVAEVEATLRPGIGFEDIMAATFPCGSVTGAPKIMAMHQIDQLEASPRGPYCGAIGWLGHEDFEFSVAIRTAFFEPEANGHRLTWGTGGGIVADSDPDEEWHETQTKHRVLDLALAPWTDQTTHPLP